MELNELTGGKMKNEAIRDLRDADYTQSKALFARILAEENITVSFSATIPTAAFDVKTRHMILPNFVVAHKAVTNMLVGHEVGHALFTPSKAWQDLKNRPKDVRARHSYYNIVEDCRIERKIKQKYYGLTHEFIDGYKYMHETMDLFGIKALKETYGPNILKKLPLIDRINLYFKAGLGPQDNLTFSDKEWALVEEVRRISTFDEMVELAEKIYAMAKEDAKTDSHQAPQDSESDDSEESDSDSGMQDDDDETPESDEKDEEESQDSGDSDDDSMDMDPDWDDEDGDADDSDSTDGDLSDDSEDDSETKKDPGGNAAGEAPEFDEDDNLESLTNQSEQNKLEDLRGDDTHAAFTGTILPLLDSSEFIVGYKEFLKDAKARLEGSNTRKTEFLKFQNASKSYINYMAKEFEMRKSATRHAQTKVARTGKIDPLRLHAYKIADDIFARNEIHPDGKNHGLSIMVDWSGSMGSAFPGVIRQLLQLVWFCKKVNIPFEVVTFTSVWNYGTSRNRNFGFGKRSKHPEGSWKIEDDGTTMINILSSKMKNRDFADAAFFLWLKAHGKINSSYLSTGGTPLSNAINIFASFVHEMKEEYNLDKISSILITDGEGSNVTEIRTPSGDGKYVHMRDVAYVKDVVTGKTVLPVKNAGWNELQVGTFLEALKVRVNGPVLGFYIIKSARYGIEGHSDQVSSDIRELNKKGMVLGRRAGYDKYFIITVPGLMIDDEKEELTRGTSKEVAKQLKLRASKKKDTRKLLGEFITTIA